MIPHAVYQEQQKRSFPTIAQILEELEKDLQTAPPAEHTGVTPHEKQTMLSILDRAADDSRFLARLAEDPGKVLKEFALTSEQKAALASGDLRRIESWVGKLDRRRSTWIVCRLQQEKW